MTDRRDIRLRELAYRLVRMAPPAPPFPEEPMARLSSVRPDRPHRPLLWAATAAVVVAAAVGLPALLLLTGDDPATGTFVPVGTTGVPGTTQPVVTSRVPDTSTSTSSAPTTVVPGDLIDIDGLDWVRTDSSLGQIIGSDGRVVADHSTPMTGAKSLAWDGDDGLVILGGTGDLRNGDLRWVTPEDARAVPVEWPAEDEGMIVDVAVIGDRPVVALRSFAGELYWFDLETGAEVAGDPDLADYFEDLGTRLGGQGRTVVVDYPENLDAERDETGALVWPFDLPELVVRGPEGEELARIELGSEQQPFALLHDFDGRRVVVSVEPNEPAFAPRTISVIDLECADCTEIVEAPGADTLELVGVLPSDGPVVARSTGS
jgi:hypothetical protein